MIKLIVCDDIPVIRNNIVSLIKERYPECEIAGVYFDGAQVLEHLQKESVDIIISDIKMKTVTGIDILKYVNDNTPSTKVIIITAYPEFDYARDAVNFHAVSFITKPINPNAFLKTVGEVIKEISDGKREESQTDIARLVLQRNETQRRLEALCKGKLTFKEFEEYCLNEANGYLKKNLYTVKIKIKNPDENKGKFSWYDIAECYNETMDSYIVSSAENECSLLVFTESSPEAAERFEDWLNQIKKTFCVFHRLNISVIQSRFENISYLYGKNKNSAEQYIQYIQTNNYESKLSLEREVLESFSLEDELAFIAFLSNHFSAKLDEDFKVSVKSKAQANELFKRLTVKINKITESEYKTVLFKKIDRYLVENFSDPALSLDSVSSLFNFSSSYLSKLFSEYNGIPFTERLTQIRLENAKKLLENPDISIKEIAARIGYNEKYFSKLFTRRFGMNPRLYRNRSLEI